MLSLLLLALAHVATPMTLRQAFALADKNQDDVKLARLSLEQAQQGEKGSYQSILPRLDFAASVTRSYSTTSQPVITGNSFQVVTGFAPTQWFTQIVLSQNIIDGGKWWTRISKGHTDREAAEAQLAEARLQAHSTIAHLFYELFRAQRSLEILQVNVTRSKEQVERAQALYQAGRGPKSDVFAAQVNLANDQISVAQQQAAVDLARNALNIPLGRPAEQGVSPVPGNLSAVPPPVNPADADAQALANRPGLLALRKQVKSAEDDAEIARGDYYPSLSAQIAYVRGPGALGTVVNNPADDFTAQGSIDLQWNLFEGRATEVAVEKAEIAASTARVQLQKSERQVEQDTEKATRTLSEDLQTLKIASASQGIAAKGLELAQERFRAGAASNLEVRDAQLKLTQAELTLVSTQIDVRLAFLDVKAAEGTL